MTKPSKADRDAILARRSLFLTTALATLNCGGPPVDETATSIKVAESASASSGSGSKTESKDGPSSRPRSASFPPWSEVTSKFPPRDSESASPEERRILDSIPGAFEGDFKALEAIWTAGLCDPGLPECREAWRALGKTLKPYHRNRSFGGCSGPVAETATTVARREAYRQLLQQTVERTEEILGKIAQGYGPSSEQIWLSELAFAKAPVPMPCLSPCAMPEVRPITSALDFQAGSVTLDERAQTAVKAIASEILAQRGRVKVSVRGHADRSEGDALLVSQKRGEAVRKALLAEGVPESAITLAPKGDTLPLAFAGSAKNRVVDFEVVDLNPRAPR